MKKRVLSLILAVVMSFSLLVSISPTAGAANSNRYVYAPEPSRLNSLVTFLEPELLKHFSDSVCGEALNFITDNEFTTYGEVSPVELDAIAYDYNRDLIGILYRAIDMNWDTGVFTRAAVTEVPSLGIKRLVDTKTNEFIVDANGNFPFCYVAGDVPAEDIAVENVHANKWCGLTERSKEVETVTHDALASAVIELNDAGIECSLVQGYYNEILYWFICTPDYKYYCNSKNEMFVAPAEASATDLNRPYVDDDGNPLDIEKVLDLENNILNLPGDNGLSLELSIGNISYDAGDKSYTVNAYTTINEGDEYYYTYYTYNIQYNITNTYITYIGSNEPYERKEYELYYQLPDGRNSADLTAEEVAGMSFEFYDVMNYSRSTDDVTVRGLYHFDGNLDDSSYFTEPDRITWNDGASITYMESPGAFGGNLYLDNTAHSFNVRGTAKFAKEDFTIQFRYYQASEPDTQDNVENFLSGDASLLSNAYLLKWDESSLYDMDGKYLAALPVGTWNEIAVVRHQGFLFYYLNGHCIGYSDQRVVMGDTITFTLGDTSRAYSMIDELRILNFAFVTGAADYTPTTVPHDSNLVLILPNAARPIADEYYEVKSSGTNLLGYEPSTFLTQLATSTSPFNCSATHSSLDFYPDFVSLKRLTTTDLASSYKASAYVVYGNPCSGFYVPVKSLGLSTSTSYTLSVVLSDGSIYSMPFTTPSTIFNNTSWDMISNIWGDGRGGGQALYSAAIPGGSLLYARYANNANVNATDYLIIKPEAVVGASLDIMYIELVKGSSTDLFVEKVTAVYDAEDLDPNTAAIQTTIPVKGYTVGGVRPTMPAKGDLWFPVMENRITGVQIYAGTHWEEVNARWWTGSRWIPIYAFDINTLEDLFDIADGDGVVSLLPDTNSFFRWWQLQWLDFRAWLEDALANIGSGTGPGSGSDCQHVYSSEVSREPGCVEPGTTLYTCSNCGHQYTELIDAHGHDWITTDTVPDVLDENGTVIEKGYEILTCSVCDATAKDYGDGPEEDDLFDALGDLLAGGVEWLLDKLSQLADRLRLITDTFTEYIEKVKDFGGEYPAFFAAAFLLIPEELRILFWLAVVGVVVLAVWKKYSS